jgi:hypothetical protein
MLPGLPVVHTSHCVAASQASLSLVFPSCAQLAQAPATRPTRAPSCTRARATAGLSRSQTAAPWCSQRWLAAPLAPSLKGLTLEGSSSAGSTAPTRAAILSHTGAHVAEAAPAFMHDATAYICVDCMPPHCSQSACCKRAHALHSRLLVGWSWPENGCTRAAVSSNLCAACRFQTVPKAGQQYNFPAEGKDGSTDGICYDSVCDAGKLYLKVLGKKLACPTGEEPAADGPACLPACLCLSLQCVARQ